MNALMILLALRLGGWRMQPVRVLLGALAGAAIAQAAGTLSRIQGAFLWLPAAVLMMRIAVGKSSLRSLFAGAAMLLCAAGLAGGMVLALWGATGSLAAAYVLGGSAAAAIGLCAAHREKRAKHVRVICTYHGRSAAFDAMIDSGNTLRDYLTHRPVIVLPEKRVKGAFELAALPLRPIFAQTAGGRQRMAVLAPDAVQLEMDGMRHAVRAMIAIAPEMSESVPALVPLSLLDELWNSNRGG